MTLVPMRFKGVQWHHNPKEISFYCDKKVNEMKSPYGYSYIQDMGRKNMVIKGKGELYGKDCLQQFEKLLKLFKEGGEGVLALPQLQPIYAVFETIKIIGEPKPDLLEYSFVFKEVMERKCSDKKTTHIVEAGQNLWDISHLYSIPIDKLVELNKFVKRPDELLEGSVIKLC